MRGHRPRRRRREVAPAAAAEAELVTAALLACYGRDAEAAQAALRASRAPGRAAVMKDCKALGVELAK